MSHKIIRVYGKGYTCPIRTLYTGECSDLYLASSDGHYHAYVSPITFMFTDVTGVTEALVTDRVRVEFGTVVPKEDMALGLYLLRKSEEWEELDRRLGCELGEVLATFGSTIRKILYSMAFGRIHGINWIKTPVSTMSIFLAQMAAFKRYQEHHPFAFDFSMREVAPLARAVDNWCTDHAPAQE